MKNNQIMTMPLFLLAFLIMISGTACEKDDTWVLSLDDRVNTINKSREGIVFTFQLRDENGNTSKSFKEGENFFFHFSVRNDRDEMLIFYYPELFYSSFCEVFTQDGVSIGKPYKNVATLGVAIHQYTYPFPSDSTIKLSFPWVYEEKLWDSLFIVTPFGGYSYGKVDMYPRNTSFLEKGKYYTKFTHKFDFPRPDDAEAVEAGELTFRIDFEIK